MSKTEPRRQQRLKMIDVGHKPTVRRTAEAEGKIRLQPQTIQKILTGHIEKGDVLSAATVAGILAVKKTSEFIPLCHPIPISKAEVTFETSGSYITAKCRVAAEYKTGVEMEALVGASAALLTIWDMVKYLEKNKKGQYPRTRIDEIKVLRKEKEPTT